MRILIAEDEAVSRRLLQVTLQGWGYDVLVTTDGRAAWQALQQDDPPRIALLDWELPEATGVELCQQVRATPRLASTYLILVTSRAGKDDVVKGLGSGADDYVIKPFDRDELRARLRTAERIVQLQASLAERVAELEQSLAQIKQLHGLLPICAWCKKIRDDQNYWQNVESYIMSRTGAQFTHGICPECFEHARAQLAERSSS
jgi:DNA-binding response OmpR family regulator